MPQFLRRANLRLRDVIDYLGDGPLSGKWGAPEQARADQRRWSPRNALHHLRLRQQFHLPRAHAAQRERAILIGQSDFAIGLQ
jgi:hypothetical protein